MSFVRFIPKREILFSLRPVNICWTFQVFRGMSCIMNIYGYRLTHGSVLVLIRGNLSI